MKTDRTFGRKRYMPLLLSCLWLLFFLFAGADLRADTNPVPTASGDLLDLSIEELRTIKVATVTGASTYEQKVTEAPSSIDVITADDIRKFGYRTLADILRSVRSFYVTYDRNYAYAGVRGFNRPGDYNTRILLLVDGHRINDDIYDTAPVGTEFPLDVDLIERIEIIRGPGSSLYGSNAFFGVINIITRNGRDVNGAEVAASGGSFKTASGRATYGTKSRGGTEALVSGSWYDSGGPRHLYYPEFDTPANNNGVADHRDGDRYKSAFAKLARQDFTLEGVYGYREKDIPTGSFGTIFNDPANHTIDERAYLDLSYRHAYGQSAETMARIYYDSYNYYGYYAMDYPPPTLNKDTAAGAWWGGEIRNTCVFFKRHKVTVGAEYQENLDQSQRNYDVNPSYVYLDVNKTSNMWAAYAEDEYRLSNAVLFNIGVRHDHYSTFGHETSPRMGLIYSPADTTTVKFLFGTAFRAPNEFESFYADGITAKANPDLKPEKIDSYELIYEQYLGSHVRSSLSGFRYRINNLISLTTDSDGLQQYRNVDRIEAQGAELEIEGAWSNGVRGRISYTIQRAVDKETADVLTNSPEHLAKLNVAIPVLHERVFVDPEVQYMSRRKTLAGNYTSAFTVVNLTIFGRKLAPGLDASVSIYNLFDRNYADPGAGPPEHLQDSIAQDGRTYRIMLMYHF